MKITDVLPIRGGGVLSLVGGGGKTTTLLLLAELLQPLGNKVLVTTTTKLSARMPHSDKLVLIQNEKQLEDVEAKVESFTLLATEKTGEKLIGIPVEWVEKGHLQEKWDIILVEADGSMGKSLKANMDHEPVIPENSSIVLVVIGLDIIGKPLSEENVHRAETAGKITGNSLGTPVSADTIVKLLATDKGLLKGTTSNQQIYIILNKYDSVPPDAVDELIDCMLDQDFIDHHDIRAILVTEMQDKESPVKKVIACV